MKLRLTIFSICLGTMTSFAQNKIVISYDDNGNRIKRELVCPGCRPAPESDPDNPGTLASDNKTLPEQDALAKGKFKVYPNPANNSVHVSLDVLSLERQCRIILTDQLGREHFRQDAASALTTIPLDHLADGMYYVLIYRDKQKDVVKIVKESNGYSR